MPHSRSVYRLPFGFGNPLYNNRGCNVENSPAAQCNGNTSEIRQLTVGFYHTLHQGPYGTVKVGTQYSYNQRFAFEGVGGAPKTDEHIVDDAAPLLSILNPRACRTSSNRPANRRRCSRCPARDGGV